MTQIQYNPKIVRNLISLVSARNNTIKMLRGESPEYAPNPKYFKRDTGEMKETIERYTQYLKQDLKELEGSEELILNPELRDVIMNTPGFLLDFHPTAVYPEDPLKGIKYTDIFNQHIENLRNAGELTPAIEQSFLNTLEKYRDINPQAEYPGDFLAGTPLIYLGHIAEKRKENINGKPHLFIITRSNEQRQSGTAYPESLQPEPVQSYTNKEVTWVDNRKPFQHVTSEEMCELIRLRLADHIPPKAETALRKCILEQLVQLRDEGVRNYQSL